VNGSFRLIADIEEVAESLQRRCYLAMQRYACAMTLAITVAENSTEADRDAVLAPLRAYNIARAGDPRIRSVALLLTDEGGNHVGGLWVKCAYDWFFVELLSVPKEHRGGRY
jgi:hypothetical protein